MNHINISTNSKTSKLFRFVDSYNKMYSYVSSLTTSRLTYHTTKEAVTQICLLLTSDRSHKLCYSPSEIRSILQMRIDIWDRAIAWMKKNGLVGISGKGRNKIKYYLNNIKELDWDINGENWITKEDIVIYQRIMIGVKRDHLMNFSERNQWILNMNEQSQDHYLSTVSESQCQQVTEYLKKRAEANAFLNMVRGLKYRFENFGSKLNHYKKYRLQYGTISDDIYEVSMKDIYNKVNQDLNKLAKGVEDLIFGRDCYMVTKVYKGGRGL